MSKTRGERVMAWAERYCREPAGRYQGRRLRFSPEQQAAILAFYDDGREPDEPFRGVVGAALALVHLCSPIAKHNECTAPPIEIDSWSIWRLAELTPILVAVLERRGARVICRQLGTAFPEAA
jgi:hypothetical protein